MKRLEVTILGQSYLLSCPEGGEAALTEAALRVDREMCAIRDAGKLKARERIAVLAALNLAFELSQRPAPAREAVEPAAPHAGLADARIERLVQRIDEVLTDDGRLL
ncbi:MAG TPA: cell division protein ZapA [Methylibium sp.]|uniref:cell division protein ZapA n=1 Tax=Methylibium sp. TaxID=2067992 RepID=UPI002DC03995|nr:cell division protein ZapA [Methylibium sp.]HEU4459886.1 cell division protein ZapA [Methylibium sp.]